MLEEEDVDETSDAGTLTPGKGESMDVDNRHVTTTLFSATGSTMAGSLKESSHTPAADSMLKSQSRGVDGEGAQLPMLKESLLPAPRAPLRAVPVH